MGARARARGWPRCARAVVRAERGGNVVNKVILSAFPFPRDRVALPHPCAVRGAPALLRAWRVPLGAARLGPWAGSASVVRPAATAALLPALRVLPAFGKYFCISVRARQHMEGVPVSYAHTGGCRGWLRGGDGARHLG